ncbi:hypothetical protein E2C01_069962 [Portunus trituberculatus]|uniref:Uncharacterized protein n=1 Tax=Portunus trituberculatus TaxID=210409 RepID=A0A5B7HVX8_PORTR|nr:hypothetical protein [Portunus trituberculatus]
MKTSGCSLGPIWPRGDASGARPLPRSHPRLLPLLPPPPRRTHGKRNTLDQSLHVHGPVTCWHGASRWLGAL